VPLRTTILNADLRQTPADGPSTLPAAQGRLSLRTLVMVRWIAVSAQVVTLLIVHLLLGFTLPLQIAFGIVALSALVNIISTIQGSRGIRLGEGDAMMYLLYDIVELSALLYLTGGLQNPFAFLLLAPVTVGAGILSRLRAVILVLVALALESLLAAWHLPLPWDADHLALPLLYVFAVWLALVVSTVFISAYTWYVTVEARQMSSALAETRLALAREQRVSAVGALAAAAAHELGSPLGTIAVIAKELSRDLPAESPFAEDAKLLLSESARCRTILAELSQRKDRTEGLIAPFDLVPVSALAEAAGEPYHVAGIAVDYTTEGDPATQPFAAALPEIQHGLGNLIHNAIQFALGHVEVFVRWDARTVEISISDDGPGYSQQVLSRLGEPYISSRAGDGAHLGLGIFIAKTLLENTGATLIFSNADDSGAVARVIWPRGVFSDPGSPGTRGQASDSANKQLRKENHERSRTSLARFWTSTARGARRR
jgi:two-component system sensor histidine kinase RegB